MAAVAQHVGDLDLVLGEQLVEPLPEVGVHDRLEPAPFLALPALALPVGHPFADALGDVLAVGHQLDPARRFRDARPSMTPASSMRLLVVSGSAPEASRIWPRGRVLEDVRPAPGPGIAAAGTVGEEPDEVGGRRGIRFHESILRGRSDDRGALAGSSAARAEPAAATGRVP